MKKLFIFLWFLVLWLTQGILLLGYSITYSIWNLKLPTEKHYRMMQMIVTDDQRFGDHKDEPFVHYYPDIVYWGIGKQKKMKRHMYWSMLSEFPEHIYSRKLKSQTQ